MKLQFKFACVQPTFKPTLQATQKENILILKTKEKSQILKIIKIITFILNECQKFSPL